MTRTQKRKIIVNDIEYEWCIRGHAIYAEHMAIYKPNINGTSIQLDIIPWGIEIRPSTVADVILFSLKNGWVPTTKGQPLRIGFSNDKFIILPEDCRNSLDYEKLYKKSDGK